jgi:cyanophycinase
VKITSGLGLIDGVIIDTHFVREEESVVSNFAVVNPRILGIGLGEDTLLITNNNQMEAIGSWISYFS